MFAQISVTAPGRGLATLKTREATVLLAMNAAPGFGITFAVDWFGLMLRGGCPRMYRTPRVTSGRRSLNPIG
jgi:hypothetical protein